MVDDATELPSNGVKLEIARQKLETLRGKQFINHNTGIAAQLSSSAKGKLISNKATGKSKANGFSQEQHNAMAANIGSLFEDAYLAQSRHDRGGDANILSIKRFVRKVRFGNIVAAAWITVKESKQHGHHIYSVEAIKLEALDRIVEVVSGNAPHASSASSFDIIHYMINRVNRAFSKMLHFATQSANHGQQQIG